MAKDPAKKSARRARRKARRNPVNTNRCAFGDGTAACSASVSSSSSAPKAKKNKFGKGVKSGNKLKGGKALVRQNKRAVRKQDRNTPAPNPNQKHANPRNLGGPL